MHGRCTVRTSSVIPRQGLCVIGDPVLAIYWSYIHSSVVVVTFPTVTMITFGLLTYRNMRSLKRTTELSNADSQLAIMVFLQVILALIATFPYASYNIYALATANMVKGQDQATRDVFIVSVTTLTSISHFGVSVRCIFFVLIGSVFKSVGKLLRIPRGIKPVSRKMQASPSLFICQREKGPSDKHCLVTGFCTSGTLANQMTQAPLYSVMIVEWYRLLLIFNIRLAIR